MKREETVLCYLEKDGSFLMLHRNKRDVDINKDKWIGVGGHLEDGETKEQALIREIKEETGLLIKGFDYRGDLIFINNDYDEIMYLYTSRDFEGDLIECNEGELCWVKKEDILNLNLWEGDRYFLPKLINTKEFIKMTLIYKDDQLVKVVEGN